MNKLLFVAFAALLCYSGSEALHCNQCAGLGTSDCARGEPSAMENQDCDEISQSMLFSSVFAKPVNMADASNDYTCVTISITDNLGMVMRGCAIKSMEGVFEDYCEYLLNKPEGIVDKCSSCDSDLCN